MEKEKRNVMIDLWKFFIVITIIGFNIQCLLGTTTAGNGFYIKITKWFFGSNYILIMIGIIYGYFLVRKYKNNNINSSNATKETIKFMTPIIKKILPLLVIGYIFSTIIGIRIFNPNYNLLDFISLLINNIWSIIGFSSLNYSYAGNIFYYLNTPLGFISSLIISSYFIYYGLCRNEDLFKGLFVPSLLIIFTTILKNMILNSLVFAFYGMLIGVIVYYIVEKLKKVKYNKNQKLLLTILNAICSLLLIWYAIYMPTIFNLEFSTIMFLCITVLIITLINQDYFTSLVNNDYSTKIVFKYLGEISLYIYILHYPVSLLVLRILGPNTVNSMYSLFEVYIPTLSITIALAAFTKNLLDNIKMTKK